MESKGFTQLLVAGSLVFAGGAAPSTRLKLQLKRLSLGRTRVTIAADEKRRTSMAKYLISFPSAAMVVPDGELKAVGRDAHAVIDEAKAAGVYVFGGGIDGEVQPVLVSGNGTVAQGGYPWAPSLGGGFTNPALAGGGPLAEGRDSSVWRRAWARR